MKLIMSLKVQCNASYNIDSNEEINLNDLLKYLNNNNISKIILEYGCEIIFNEKELNLFYQN